MRDCIAAMESVFLDLAAGRAVQPVRNVLAVPRGAGSLYTMPGFLGHAGAGALAVKMVTLFPGNASRGLESHQGVIVLFDARNGRALAIIEAASVTALRTAAVSALATRLLSNPDASRLALFGSGVQAWSHFEAMLEVRPVRRVRVWSRTPEHATRFASRATQRFGIPVEPAPTPEHALRDAEIICTVTGSTHPIVRRDWIADGAHINAVGASTAQAREIDSATASSARIVVDSLAAALAEAGDVLIPIGEGVLSGEALTELSAVAAGEARPRTSASDVTLFESLGLAVEDAGAARTVYERALAAGAVPVAFD